jgi:hypothetical protein
MRNHWLQRFPVLVLFCLWVALPVSGQNAPGAIAGSVQDSAGAMLVSAKVTIQPSGRQAATDNEGQFRITNLPA